MRPITPSIYYKLFIFIPIVVFLFASCGGSDDATIKEETITLKTYPFGDPDPVAHPESHIYPYFRFDGYATEGEEREWKSVIMENDYITVTIMPEIGGKVWGAIEKSTETPFIYYNDVVKFRDVAMRGPWTSGGIEANFGVIGHIPTTATPVDYYTRTNEDGSVSCFVAALELITDTWWSVEINLPKDKAYFTTKTIWHNNSPLSQPYYHWMNAGFKASDDLEFYFSGQYYIGHDGEVSQWPLHETGKNLAKYMENNFGGYKSYHVLGNLNDFYAAYYHNSNFGSVHYVPYDEKLGMKIWLWGHSRQGMIWEDLLTDTNGQYVELQSGRLFNQAAAGSMFTPFKEFTFDPYTTDSWTEYWYPIKSIGGIQKANEYGALNVEKKGDELILHFCPAQNLKTEVKVFSGNEEIYSETHSFDVLETWENTIPLTDPSKTIKVIISKGLLEYTDKEEDYRLSRPMQASGDFDWGSAYGFYLRGQQEKAKKYETKAIGYLLASLEKEPNFIPALNELAEIYYKYGRYEEALALTKKTLSVDAYQPKGNFLYGLINSKLHRMADAYDGFSVASLSPSYRADAYLCLAKELAKDGNWIQVLRYANQSIDNSNGNIEAMLLKALAYRKMDEIVESTKLLSKMEEYIPLNHHLRFEKYLQVQTGKNNKRFIELIRNEFPHETYLEIGNWYEELNCINEALLLYSWAPQHPLILYRVAFLLNKQGNTEESQKYLKLAGISSPYLVFPHGSENIEVLKWAVKQNTNWKSRYYLGLLYASLGQPEKASTYLELCRNVPRYAPFYLTRAAFRQADARLADLLTAEKIDTSWRAGLALIDHYTQNQQFEKAFAYAERYKNLYPKNYNIGLKYASVLVAVGEYQGCIDYLQELQVLPNEGAHQGRIFYRDACLLLALQSIAKKDYENALALINASEIWYENLGVGKPYNEDIDLRSEDYMRVYCFQKMNLLQQAKQIEQNISTQTKFYNANELLSALVLEKQGHRTQADSLIANYEKNANNKEVAAWCKLFYTKKYAEAASSAKKLNLMDIQNAAWEKDSRDYNFRVAQKIVEVCK